MFCSVSKKNFMFCSKKVDNFLIIKNNYVQKLNSILIIK